jgi:hypothetical protein
MSTYWPDVRIRKSIEKNSQFNLYEVIEESITYGLPDITIPVGFKTDFSSVPRILWPIIPPFGKAVAASILHDYMYTNRYYRDMLGDVAARYWADDFFYRNLLDCGVKKWQAKSMWLAVRWFGKSHWDRSSEN